MCHAQNIAMSPALAGFELGHQAGQTLWVSQKTQVPLTHRPFVGSTPALACKQSLLPPLTTDTKIALNIVLLAT